MNLKIKGFSASETAVSTTLTNIRAEAPSDIIWTVLAWSRLLCIIKEATRFFHAKVVCEKSRARHNLAVVWTNSDEFITIFSIIVANFLLANHTSSSRHWVVFLLKIIPFRPGISTTFYAYVTFVFLEWKRLLNGSTSAFVPADLFGGVSLARTVKYVAAVVIRLQWRRTEGTFIGHG